MKKTSAFRFLSELGIRRRTEHILLLIRVSLRLGKRWDKRFFFRSSQKKLAIKQ